MKLLIVTLTICCGLHSASVLTANRDVQRTGANTSERLLTPSAVTGGKVVKFGSCAVDGYTYGQALLVPDVVVAGANHRHMAVVATMHGTMYGLDVGALGCSQIWSLHLSDPIVGGGFGTHDYYDGEVGCASTPTVDEVNKIAYATCANSGTGASASWTLYKIDLTTGTLLTSTVISGEFSGTGKLNCDGVLSASPLSCIIDVITAGKVQFQAQLHQSRAGLLALGGSVFTGFASWGDYFVFHGWLFGHSASTLAAAGTYNTSANSCGAGIWQSGGGIASDGTNMYVMTGNGAQTLGCGASPLSESVIKLDSSLNVLASFTASDQVARDDADGDLGSGRCIVAISNTKIICGGKALNAVNTKIFVLNTSDMTLAQTLDMGVSKSNFNGMTLDGNNNLFVAGRAEKIYRFPYSGGGAWATSPDVSSAAYNSPGAFLASSSNGTATGIVWAVTPDASESSAPQIHTLRALNPTNLTEYSNWTLSPGKGLKFSPPTVVNGLVLVPTDRNLTVFGVSPPSTIFPMPGTVAR